MSVWHRIAEVVERLISLLGLILVSPVLALLAAAIVVEDGSPVLFRQLRIGRHGNPFWLLKLRSMRNGKAGMAITAKNDSRITRMGSFLRKYKLDELPQLWNVVRGDMNLIGPRPEVPAFVDLESPVWRAVLAVRPGISDLATLIYRNEEEILGARTDPEAYYRAEVLPDKLALNLEYIRRRTPLSDLRLIAMTVRYSFFPAGFRPEAVRQAFSK